VNLKRNSVAAKRPKEALVHDRTGGNLEYDTTMQAVIPSIVKHRFSRDSVDLMEVKTVGLLDHMGGGNLGDDGTQEAVIHNIRSRWPSAAIFTFSMNPSDSEARHGIGSYAIRRKTWTFGATSTDGTLNFQRRVKAAALVHPALLALLRTIYTLAFKIPAACYGEVCFLARSLRVLRSFDLLVISGGGQLTESWGGPWEFPYTIFKWIFLARLARVKPVFLNVGAGPLARPLSKYFIRTALSLADYVSFRDTKSADLIQHIGFRGDTPVFPDAVYSLKIDSCSARRPATQRPTNVGIAPMPYGLKPLYADGNPHAYDSLIRGLAAVGSRLLADEGRITLFCTDIGVDPPSVHDLQRAINNTRSLLSDDLVDVVVPRSTTDLLCTMSAMDYVITCRFHGVVFAHLLNIPVIALSHHPKVMTLMDDLGLSRYCLDIRTVDADTLTDTFSDLVLNAAQIKSRMNAMYSSYKDMLARQFDDLFPHSVGA
jgi:polysaccharide pyruvyl transferase WcaK-like protein